MIQTQAFQTTKEVISLKERTLEFVVSGKYGLFTDPITKIGGERLSYPVPTYEAIKGIMKNIYWKPSFDWIIDEIRVMNPIRMESKGTKPITMDGKNSLAYNTCLRDVSYQVRGHFEFNPHYPQLKQDWNEKKHMAIAKRALENGGRRPIFLGVSEYQGYVEPCEFGAGEGYYDHSGKLSFGVMFHGFNYPSDTGRNTLETRLWMPEMDNGCIRFIRPEECRMVRTVREFEKKEFEDQKNFSFVS